MNEDELKADLIAGLRHRYEMWLKDVRAWAKLHEISEKSAIGILFENGSLTPSQHSLNGWMERHNFFSMWLTSQLA